MVGVNLFSTTLGTTVMSAFLQLIKKLKNEAMRINFVRLNFMVKNFRLRIYIKKAHIVHVFLIISRLFSSHNMSHKSNFYGILVDNEPNSVHFLSLWMILVKFQII